MAGETLSYSELKDWYNAFNSVITNYGGEIANLIIPSQDKASPSDVNNLLNKITELANEEYLGTQPSLYITDYSVVAQGDKIQRSAAIPINDTANNIVSIKCRNTVTYSCGKHNSGVNSNGTNTDGMKVNTLCSSGTQSSGTKGCGNLSQGGNAKITYNSGLYDYGTKSNLWNFQGWGCSSGTCNSGTNSNVNKTNGFIIDILNANTSY